MSKCADIGKTQFDFVMREISPLTCVTSCSKCCDNSLTVGILWQVWASCRNSMMMDMFLSPGGCFIHLKLLSIDNTSVFRKVASM